MGTLTGKEVRELTTISRWNLRRCCVCGAQLYYEFRKSDTIPDDTEVFFSSACECTSLGSDLAPRSWDDVAKTLNIQTNEDVRTRMLRELAGEQQATGD